MLIRELISEAELKQLVATAMEYARKDGLLPEHPTPAEADATRTLVEDVGAVETAPNLIPTVVAQHVREELRALHMRRTRPQVEQLFQSVLRGVAGPGRRLLVDSLALLSAADQRLVHEVLLRKQSEIERDAQQRAQRRGIPPGF